MVLDASASGHPAVIVCDHLPDKMVMQAFLISFQHLNMPAKRFIHTLLEVTHKTSTLNTSDTQHMSANNQRLHSAMAAKPPCSLSEQGAKGLTVSSEIFTNITCMLLPRLLRLEASLLPTPGAWKSIAAEANECSSNLLFFFLLAVCLHAH